MPVLEWFTTPGGAITPLPPGDWSAKYEPGAGTSTTISALLVGHAYVFRARAINSIGVRSAWSTQVAIRIPTQPLVQTAGIAFGAVNSDRIQTGATTDYAEALIVANSQATTTTAGWSVIGYTGPSLISAVGGRMKLSGSFRFTCNFSGATTRPGVLYWGVNVYKTGTGPMQIINGSAPIRTGVSLVEVAVAIDTESAAALGLGSVQGLAYNTSIQTSGNVYYDDGTSFALASTLVVDAQLTLREFKN